MVSTFSGQPQAIAAGERLNIRLMPNWPESVSGLLLRDSRVVGLNGRHAPTRRRFSLAHELGHWFLRHDQTWHEEEITIDSPPEQFSVDANKIAESEANEFAGELLASRAMLKDSIKHEQDGNKLAALFGMSPQALWVQRLKHNLV